MKKYLEFIGESNDEIILLYHGSSEYGEKKLLKNGWQPNKVSSGGQQGNPSYLYLALTPEMACGCCRKR